MLALPAAAGADAEPNNALWQAEGPISGGVDVTGTLATSDDVDWYSFYAQPQQQLHLTGAADDEPDGSCIDMYDSDGQGVPSDYTTPAGGVRRYFVSVGYGCSGPGYHFRIDPASAFTTGPAMPAPVGTGEPNESRDQGSGPLAGATTYTGAIQTQNDQDWFYLYTTPGTHQLDIAVTGIPSSCSSTPTVRLQNGDSSSDYASPYPNRISHITRTVTGAQRLDVSVNADEDACVGDSWQFRVEPADAVTGTAPGNPATPLPPATTPITVTTDCLNARNAVRQAKRNVNKAVKRLRHAHGHARKVWKHRLAVATVRLKRARARQAGAC
jgi:hypothetical protein